MLWGGVFTENQTTDEGRVLPVPPLTNLMVSLTNQCTLRCPFCFVDHEVTRMSYQTMFDTVQFLIRNSEACGRAPRLVFFGGEPMMEWDSLIVPITDYIRKEYGKQFYLSMTTNLTLLNEERIRYILDNDIACLFSVDGARETMGINRPFADGSNSFEVIDEKAGLVTAMVPGSAARMTLCKETAGNFLKDILYVEGKGFGSISVLPDLFSRWTEEQTRAMEEQIRCYGDYLIASFRSGRTPTVFQQYSEMFFKMVLTNKCLELERPQSMAKCHGCGKCGFGQENHATTDYQGNIFGCLHPAPLTKESPFYLGDIYHGVDPERTRRLVEQCDAEVPGGLDCAGCKLAAVCDRGCAPNNYIIVGKMNTPPETYCHFNRALMDDALRMAAVLGEEENETFRAFFQSRVRRG